MTLLAAEQQRGLTCANNSALKHSKLVFDRSQPGSSSRLRPSLTPHLVAAAHTARQAGDQAAV
jgi:hypothetical protein